MHFAAYLKLLTYVACVTETNLILRHYTETHITAVSEKNRINEVNNVTRTVSATEMQRPQTSEIWFTCLILSVHELEGSVTNEFWIQTSIGSEEQGKKNSLLKWNLDIPFKFPLARLLFLKMEILFSFETSIKKLQGSTLSCTRIPKPHWCIVLYIHSYYNL